MKELVNSMFFGVIGNFAGHLEQAKEASDFADGSHPDAPKGIFPIYIPQNTDFIGRFCVGNELVLDGDFVQIEPEVALFFELEYDENGDICAMHARKFAAFNDASKRIKAPKIAEKKNFSTCCKGLGNWLDFRSWDELAALEICSYLKRDGKWYEYGQRKGVNNYYYFGDELISWILSTLKNQQNEGTLQPLRPLIAAANRPKTAIFCIGATPYTEHGDGNYLRSGDELFVGIAPKAAKCDYNSQPNEQISCFIQTVK